MLIRIADFKGRIPRSHPRLIPQNFAQVAKNTRLEDGTVGPVNAPVTAHTFGSTPQSFIKFDGAFVLFNQPNINATVGPVAQDRLYYTGNGSPKMRVSGVDYELALFPPSAAPSVSVSTPSVGDAPTATAQTVTKPDDTTHQYRYSAIMGNGVEIYASTESDVISRWEGKGVKLANITLPSGAKRFRVYRKDLQRTNTSWGLIADKLVSKLVRKSFTDDFSADRDVSDQPILTTMVNIPASLTNYKNSWVAAGNNLADFPSVGGAPKVSRTELAVKDQPRYTYRYSAVIDGIETIASAASEAVIRIDGQNVVLSGLTLPAGTDRVRVYRSDVIEGSAASARFGRIMDVAASSVVGGQITDTFAKRANLTIQPVNEADRAALEETVTYVYTYVTSLGEESQPSPPSELATVVSGDTVTVGLVASAQSSRLISKIRVYRSRTSLSGITDFYFLSEVNAATGPFSDTLKKPLNEILPSTDYNTPSASMLGLIALPNGMMACHSGRELMFCEPFIPHAWPVKYRLTTDSEIVGLGAFGSFVAVMTKGAPYLVQGSEPSLMVMEKLEQTLPCLSRHSIVDMGYSVAFASHEGLVVLSQEGASVATRGLFSEEQWRKMRPESFRAAQLNGRYCFSYQPIVNGARKFGIIDLSGEQPFFIEADIAPTVMHFSPDDGALYYVEGNATVKQWDPQTGTTVMKQAWRSKRFILPGYENFGAFLVETDAVDGTKAVTGDPDCVVRFYADGNLIHTTSTLNRAGRLPAGFLSDTWEVEVEGYAPVTAISIATDIFELAEG